LQTIENASWAIGPVLGGLLTAAAGPHTAYWINAGSFLVSAVLVARIPARLLQSTTALTRGHWTDLKDGFAAVLRSRPLLAVLLGWGLASLASGAINVSEVFLAKNTLHGGDFGYGLLYGGIGTGLVLGSFWSNVLVERIGIARAYASGLTLMALGFGVGAASADIWMAAGACVIGGIGNGVAVVCNALLVQRGIGDDMRGRALTFVMSATFGLTGIGTIVAGAFMPADGARWVWLAGAIVLLAAAGVGYALARDAQDKTAAPAEASPV
jgi:MFS family permease